MDGCLTDFDKNFKLFSKGKYVKTSQDREKVIDDGGSKFWSSMEWIEGGKELVKFCLSKFPIVRILSSAGIGNSTHRYPIVRRGKMEWVSKNIPQINEKSVIIVPNAALKSTLYSGKNNILVDDKKSTIISWNKRGGIGILHTSSEYNKSIEKLKSI